MLAVYSWGAALTALYMSATWPQWRERVPVHWAAMLAFTTVTWPLFWTVFVASNLGIIDTETKERTVPLVYEKEADRITEVPVTWGDTSFDIGVYLMRMSEEVMFGPEGVPDELSDLDQEAEAHLLDVFAYWEIAETEQDAAEGKFWPVDRKHLRRIPGPLMAAMMRACVAHTAEEGKGSAGGSRPKG